MEQTESQTTTELAAGPPATDSMLAVIDRAAQNGASIETMERLMAMKERWDEGQARKAFNNAIAQAKAEMPVIIKDRVVDFKTNKGHTHYAFEDLAGIANTIDPVLSRHGLSYRFRTDTTPSSAIVVTCIVAHRDGHTEETSLPATADTSGNKNAIQAIGSTVTYLQRYTLKAALGLAASADTDGRTPKAPGNSDHDNPPPYDPTMAQETCFKELRDHGINPDAASMAIGKWKEGFSNEPTRGDWSAFYRAIREGRYDAPGELTDEEKQAIIDQEKQESMNDA